MHTVIDTLVQTPRFEVKDNTKVNKKYIFNWVAMPRREKIFSSKYSSFTRLDLT